MNGQSRPDTVWELAKSGYDSRIICLPYNNFWMVPYLENVCHRHHDVHSRTLVTVRLIQLLLYQRIRGGKFCPNVKQASSFKNVDIFCRKCQLYCLYQFDSPPPPPLCGEDRVFLMGQWWLSESSPLLISLLASCPSEMNNYIVRLYWCCNCSNQHCNKENQ